VPPTATADRDPGPPGLLGLYEADLRGRSPTISHRRRSAHRTRLV